MKYLKALWLTIIDEEIFPWLFVAWVLSGALWFPLGTNDVGVSTYLLKVVSTFSVSFIVILLSIGLYNLIKLLVTKYKSHL